MPKRTDIKKILIIGSGPIVISQACEFDYSGTQACKALKEEGFEIVLINSNPATIMTDPEVADRTYIEPITPEVVEAIIAKERPDALLPTLGGQTALNVCMQVAQRGALEKYNVELIGASIDAIKRAEDRELFKKTMESIGLEVPRAGYARTMEEAQLLANEIGFPMVIRPSFTLGGTGGGIAYNVEEFERIARLGLELSMIHEISVEESVVGWKEYELEVMRDKADNVVIVCPIENFDPMGVHTGDSITVAPAQTLTDVEYQQLRNASIAIIKAIGVETGGSNIQFAVHPGTGKILVIEMNPRVSRSSALASKATGFPIAKIAAKLAVGYTLDEIPNDITKKTPACFEPTIDYVVVKIPRFAFEKFPGSDPTLTIQMKSVGETMAIGRTFKEALQKGLRGLEVKKSGWETDIKLSADELKAKLSVPTPDRLYQIKSALLSGISVEEIASISKIDIWFLNQLKQILDFEQELRESKNILQEGTSEPASILLKAKQYGFSDRQLAHFWSVSENEVRQLRDRLNVTPSYYLVDTCAAEFEAYTPYYYSTYENQVINIKDTIGDKRQVTSDKQKRKVIILGGGPNRIGQGIEFDYCCVHAAFALKELGIEVIMVNSNPETVSTDYDTSDKLYFEPVTLEDVLNIIEREKPEGVIVQFGGQTPLNLSTGLAKAGVRILGTDAKSIDDAEDREKFRQILNKLKLRQPPSATALTMDQAFQAARSIGYPVLVRPSYVLGGRAMEIVYDEAQLEPFANAAFEASAGYPVLIDKFLEDAIEVDVDLIGDGERFVIAGMLEHIEEAGAHSGDSAMVFPPYTLSEEVLSQIRSATVSLAKALKIVGLMNVQYAIKDDIVYVLEVNPRASRTVPFISKAIGVPLAKLAAKALVGVSLLDQGFVDEVKVPYQAVKESVFPFARFRGVDIILGPEMKSTGEVMGIDRDFGRAFLKSQLGAGQKLTKSGTVFVSVKNKDKRAVVFIAKRLEELGFKIVSTQGTANVLIRYGVKANPIKKIHEGRPNILDAIKNGQVCLIINTPSGRVPRADEIQIRAAATSVGIPCITTISGAQASITALEILQKEEMQVKPIQDYHEEVGTQCHKMKEGAIQG